MTATTTGNVDALSVWPANRARGDYRTELREAADTQPRRIICGYCGVESPLLDGPTGRAWFASHTCRRGPVA